jgi:capsular polysaccharide biosynthesis protein
VGAGLGLALMILYILMIMDKTFHTENDVEACLKVPVLVGIPMLEVPAFDNGGTALSEHHAVASE